MIKHVVMWKFNQGEEENMHTFLNALGKLKGVIPAILDQEIGVNCNKDGCYDAVLISVFQSMETLNAYKNDPRHLEVAKLCATIRLDRVAVDFQVEG